MKRYLVLSFIAAGMLLTACSGKQDSETAAPAETVQTTAAETAASSAVQTETAASSESTVSPESTAFSGTGASAETTAAPQTSAAPETNTQAESAAPVTAAETSAVQQEQKGLVPLQEAVPPDEPMQMLKAAMDGIVKQERSAVLSNTDLQDGARLYTVITGEGSAEERLDEMFEEVKEEVTAYKIGFTAKRPDLLWWYEESLEALRSSAGGTDAAKQKANEVLSTMGGVTEIYSAELEFTNKDGKTNVTALPLMMKNGKWVVDFYICGFMRMPMTRDDIKQNHKNGVSQLYAVVDVAYQTAVQEHSDAASLENKEITWAAADFAQIAGMKDKTANTPEEHLKKALSAHSIQYELFSEIRFMLKNGRCYALAAKAYDGYVWSNPLIRTDKEYTSLDEAFRTAMEAADEPVEDKID